MIDLFNTPIGKASMPVITQTKIICGDCAGNELLPIQTNLTTDRRCAGCGGRSYEFASLVGPALATYLRNTKKEIDHVKQNNSTNRAAESPARYASEKLRLVG